MHREQLLSELKFKATRSSGPGGQHVNKTSTRVELTWSLENSKVFSEEEKVRLREKLEHRLTTEGLLKLASEHTRSQHRNKEDVIKRFLALLEVGLQKPKIRKKTKPSKVAHLKRLKNKKQHSEKKANRKRPEY